MVEFEQIEPQKRAKLMKTFILFIVVFIGYNDIIGQNAIIKLKNGKELATSIQAMSENSIFSQSRLFSVSYLLNHFYEY